MSTYAGGLIRALQFDLVSRILQKSSHLSGVDALALVCVKDATQVYLINKQKPTLSQVNPQDVTGRT